MESRGGEGVAGGRGLGLGQERHCSSCGRFRRIALPLAIDASLGWQPFLGSSWLHVAGDRLQDTSRQTLPRRRLSRRASALCHELGSLRASVSLEKEPAGDGLRENGFWKRPAGCQRQVSEQPGGPVASALSSRSGVQTPSAAAAASTCLQGVRRGARHTVTSATVTLLCR